MTRKEVEEIKEKVARITERRINYGDKRLEKALEIKNPNIHGSWTVGYFEGYLAGIDSLSMIVEDMLDVLGYEIEEDAEATKEVFDN